jgi:hypothetical protein
MTQTETMPIGKRVNYAEGIQSGEAFTRHDRQIGATTYRLVHHWRFGKVRTPSNTGIIVYRIDTNSHGEVTVTLLRSLGRPFPKSAW